MTRTYFKVDKPEIKGTDNLCPTCGQPMLNQTGITIDRATRCVFAQDRRVELSPKEIDLLAYIVSEYPKFVTRERVLAKLWHLNDPVPTIVDVTLTSIRKKLKKGNMPFTIETMHSRGYRVKVL